MLIAGLEGIGLRAKEPSLPVDAREGAVTVDARDRIEEAAILGSLSETDDDGGRRRGRRSGDRLKLGGVG